MSSSQWPQKRQTAAQRANEANRAQQVAVNDKGGRPSDRKAPAVGEALARAALDRSPVALADRRFKIVEREQGPGNPAGEPTDEI